MPTTPTVYQRLCRRRYGAVAVNKGLTHQKQTTNSLLLLFEQLSAPRNPLRVKKTGWVKTWRSRRRRCGLFPLCHLLLHWLLATSFCGWVCNRHTLLFPRVRLRCFCLCSLFSLISDIGSSGQEKQQLHVGLAGPLRSEAGPLNLKVLHSSSLFPHKNQTNLLSGLFLCVKIKRYTLLCFDYYLFHNLI